MKKKQACFNIYFLELPRFSNALREHLHNLGQDAYTKLYQATGDNIRASGHPASRKFDVEKLFDLPKTINMIIKSARFIDRKEGRSSYIAIDAIRNPYEALFFKERYSDFYLVSINTNDEDRIKHLINSKNFSAAQIKELDNKEYPKTLLGEQQFTSQNIHKCIEFADIHLHNRRGDGFDSSELRSQVAWYIALMMHPGLVMPTAEERCMQFATGAKLNSGCISRQVGAVITDQNHSVQAVGWNSSPQGQVPCILRSAEDLIIGADKEAFSQYERNDGNFIALIEDTYSDKFSDPRLAGRSLAFCFKDVQNELEAEKNQVHTRSLHAEENAFLQIAKHGGNSIEGGILFTTASPCELCSKKAYQLGITKIIYVDPYPGIANKHILDCGSRKPKLILFSGAIGSAYHKLYQPFFSYKDELRTLLSLPRKVDKKEQQIRELQHKIRLLEAKISEN